MPHEHKPQADGSQHPLQPLRSEILWSRIILEEFPVRTRYHGPALPWSVLMPLLEISAVIMQGCLRSREERVSIPGARCHHPWRRKIALGAVHVRGEGRWAGKSLGGGPGWWVAMDERDTQEPRPRASWSSGSLPSTDLTAEPSLPTDTISSYCTGPAGGSLFVS